MPLWVCAVQLLFAAVLLFVIRNPAPVMQLEARINVIDTTAESAALVVHIPLSNIAVAATGKEIANEQPM